MKRLLLLFVFFTASAYGQQQSISLPARVPVQCDGRISGSCTYTVYPGMTGIMIASDTASGNGIASITDSLGNSWQRDHCDVQGDCSWHMNFGSTIPIYGKSDTITIPPNYTNTQGKHTFLLLYEGTWIFSGRGSAGRYSDPSPFPECPSGGSCPYNWTGPIYAEAGEMLIAWADSRETGLLPKPTPPFYIEATDHVFAVEDMIAPVEGIYIGAMVWKKSDGSDWSSGHWDMGLAVYSRTN